MWKNWNACALLMQMQSSATTMEKSMAVSQKVKNRFIYEAATPFLGIPQKN